MNTGWFIYELHQFFNILMAAIFITRPAMRMYIILLFIPILLLHLSGYGCPVTRIEQHYHGHDASILDPYMAVFGIKSIRSSRKMFQACFSTFIFLAMIFVVYAYPTK
jgi:hypothetical protein